VDTLPDVRAAPQSSDALEMETAPVQTAPVETAPVELETAPAAVRSPMGIRRAWRRLAALDPHWKYPLAVYGLSRVLYLAIALADTVARRDAHGHHWSLAREVANWDGVWYVAMAAHGYPSHLDPYHYSTLGFFPLYSVVTWALGQAAGIGYVWSGLVVALALGGVTTILVGRLAERWFGRSASRRAVLFFALFPGSIVFSMDYTEGLLLALVAGAMLAVEHRRWLAAGLLAGAATAVGPVAVAILPAALVVSARELHRHGWRDPAARRSLWLPLLAPAGLVAVGTYMWLRLGTPFAVYLTQHNAWGEHSGPLALYFQARTLATTILGTAPGHAPVNLNGVVGLLGAAFLVWGLIQVWRARRSVPATALVWTLGVAFLTVTTDQVPPNPRMLLCAFPMLIVLAARIKGRAYQRLIAVTSVSVVVFSVLTFVSTSLRP
jgi:hypothetical protein